MTFRVVLRAIFNVVITWDYEHCRGYLVEQFLETELDLREGERFERRRSHLGEGTEDGFLGGIVVTFGCGCG